MHSYPKLYTYMQAHRAYWLKRACALTCTSSILYLNALHYEYVQYQCTVFIPNFALPIFFILVNGNSLLIVCRNAHAAGVASHIRFACIETM